MISRQVTQQMKDGIAKLVLQVASGGNTNLFPAPPAGSDLVVGLKSSVNEYAEGSYEITIQLGMVHEKQEGQPFATPDSIAAAVAEQEKAAADALAAKQAAAQTEAKAAADKAAAEEADAKAKAQAEADARLAAVVATAVKAAIAPQAPSAPPSNPKN